MKYKINFGFLIVFIVTFACKNYYNETIHWADNINLGSDIETVKKSQPKFVKISWDKPLVIENENYYEIVEIEGNNDFLNMQNFLVFIDGKYQGRESKK
jgi:hypothetical protein